MMEPLMKNSRGFGPLFAFLFLGFYSVHAQERVFANYNCAITPPAGWQWVTNLSPMPGFCAAFRNTAHTRIVLLTIDDKHKPSGLVDERFVAELERGIEASGGGKRVSGTFIEVAGIKGYERLGRIRVNGKEGSTITRVVPADRVLYIVQAMRFDGAANNDPEIHEALGSFRFIRAPSRPARSGSAAYQFGYLMGRLVVPLGLVGVLVAIIVASIRRKSSKGPQGPPPLPPHVRR